MKKQVLTLITLLIFSFSYSQTINTVGNSFSPDTLIVNVGDTINFVMGQTHNTVEVSQSTFIANDTTSNGGFNIGVGQTGTYIPTTAQSYYYVCQAHIVSHDMKGVIIANALPIYGCTDSLACNYDSLATIDDSSCIFPDGCTDSLACNYDSLATCDDNSCSYPQTYTQNITICDGNSIVVGSSVYNATGSYTDTITSTLGCDSIVHTNLTIYSQFNSIFGGIPNNTVGGGGFHNGSRYLELSAYMPSELVSAMVYAQDTTLTTFQIRDDNGNVLDSTTVNVIPGGHRIYFNFPLVGGSDYQLGIDGQSNNLYRHNNGVNYPYNFGALAAITGSSASSQYYYFFYDIEIKQLAQPSNYSICAGDSMVVGGNVYNASGLYTDSLTTSIGCDSLVFTNLVVYPNTAYTDSQTICSGAVYAIGNNVYDSTGIYIDSLNTQYGCDSIVTTNLTVSPDSGSITTNDTTICDGDSVVVNGNVYNSTALYSDTLTNSAGCDSIINTNLTIQTPTYQSFTICDGNSIVVGSSVYNATGSYTDTITSTLGCDSIVHTNLTIYSQFNSIFGGIPNTTIGGGGFYSGSRYLELSAYMPSELVSAMVYAQDTTLTTFQIRDDNGNVLDSTTVNVIPGGHRIYFNFPLAGGSDYQLGIDSNSTNLYRNNSGVNYPYNFNALAAITNSSAGSGFYYFFYDIEIKQLAQPSNYSICAGDSIVVGGNVYNASGLYTDSLTTSIGCDSLVFTNLIVYPNTAYTDSQTICSGEVYTIGNSVYDSTGIYIDSLNTQYGCDSVVTTNLTVLTISGGTTMNNQAICFGDSVSVGNSTYYYDGIYNDTLQDGNGCDSIIITTLVTNSAAYGSLYGGIPDTVSGPGAFSNYNGQLNLDNTLPSILKSAKVYAQDTNSVTFELRDDNGVVVQNITHTVYPGEQRLNFNFLIPVDSNLHLGVSASNSGLYRSDTADGGNWSYPFNIGPVTINSANNNNSQQYYYFYYDLEIMPYASYIDTTICNGDSISVGSNTYTTSGNYTDILTANNACDSIVYTILDLYQSPPLTINTVRICDGESITINGNVYATTGVYTDIYNAFNGCDSVVETHLTVDSAVTAQISQNGVNIGANVNGGTSPYTYFWSSGEITQSISPQSNGSYWVIATDANGCISDTAFFMVTFIPSGIDDILNAEVNIYPNPTDGLIHINSDLKIEKIELFSMEGKLLKTTIELSILLDVKGTYFIKIFTEPGNIIKRVVVN